MLAGDSSRPQISPQKGWIVHRLDLAPGGQRAALGRWGAYVRRHADALPRKEFSHAVLSDLHLLGLQRRLELHHGGPGLADSMPLPTLAERRVNSLPESCSCCLDLTPGPA